MSDKSNSLESVSNATFTLFDEILDINSTPLGNDDSWLIALEKESSSSEFWLSTKEDVSPASTKSLVQRLNEISKGSTSNSSYGSSISIGRERMSPAAYVSKQNRILNSTPISKKLEEFDSRTFTRPKTRLSLTETRHLNLTFDKEIEVVNTTFNKNETFTQDENDSTLNTTFNVQKPILNETFDYVKPSLNSTFTRRLSEDRLNDRDDAYSTNSDGSHTRLNDVGDVQHVAKLQEESLKQPYILRSSGTISPSSEHSPLAEHCEEGKGRYAQYSSQDSLPDSPYSSQSLDSQSVNALDHIGRSMPNLNKIRRGSSKLPPPSSSQSGEDRRSYALSRQTTSDTRLGHKSNNIRPIRSSIPAPRNSTGIPRLGSRIPGPSGIPRIPKPPTGVPRPSRYQ